MQEQEREQFDALLESVLETLPKELHDLLDQAPLLVDDEPDAALMSELELESADELCGLHNGLSMLERSVEDSFELPTTIHLFRRGILAAAGGWQAGEPAVREEIRVTLLHEIGHHFGMEEEDLEALGYD